MKKSLLTLVSLLVALALVAQSPSEHDMFVYNRRLIKQGHSYLPKNGYVPDKDTAVAIAYAVAVPIYGKKEMDGEKPFQAELEDGIWTIQGTFHCDSCAGGTLVMQISKASGKILFLTHTK